MLVGQAVGRVIWDIPPSLATMKYPADVSPDMTKPKVFWCDLRSDYGNGLDKKLGRLIEAAGLGDMDLEKRFVAIKLHFGERGNLAYLRPPYVRVVSEFVADHGGIPFATDCSTLYPGHRKNGIEHMQTAELNGFGSVSCGCPVVMGDGIKGTDDVELPVKNGVHCRTAKIGRAIADADAMVTLTHFKGHEMTAFGGTVKNISMGCASRRGKAEMHATEKPDVVEDGCRGCRRCLASCANGAISFVEKDGRTKASIDHAKCVGCGRCIGSCAFDAIRVENSMGFQTVVEKMVEYAEAVCDSIPCFHISIVTDVSPSCDCGDMNDTPIIPNVGMFASFDPIALDRACLDACERQPILPGSVAAENSEKNTYKSVFTAAHPDTDPAWEFAHAKRIGFGCEDYELVRVK